MPTVSLIAAISANGKIAERVGQTSLDWTSKEDTKFFVQKTKELGVVVMGRKTFETIGRPLKERLIIVMTSEPEKYEPQPGILEYTKKSPRELLDDLTSRGFSKVALAGGASVYSEFLKAGLVDELFLTVEPVLFGGGVPLAENFGRVNLELVETMKLGEQAVLLHYIARYHALEHGSKMGG